MLPRWLIIGLIALVTVAWFANTLLELTGQGTGNVTVNGLFTAVLGFVLMIAKADSRRIGPRRGTPKEPASQEGDEDE